jgi:hypothetical protein
METEDATTTRATATHAGTAEDKEKEGEEVKSLPAVSHSGNGGEETAAAAAAAATGVGGARPASSFQTSSTKAKGDAGISNGDWPHVNGALNMTVSGTKNEDSYDDGGVGGAASAAVAEGSPVSDSAVAATASSSASSSSEDDGETPMNLSPEAGEKNEEEDEAMNLCPPPPPVSVVKTSTTSSSGTSTIGLCAKMRLKKQRLAAFAAQEEQLKNAAAASAAASAAEADMQVSDNKASTSNGNPVTMSTFSENDPTSALHRLAEAAQRKQVRPTDRHRRRHTSFVFAFAGRSLRRRSILLRCR